MRRGAARERTAGGAVRRHALRARQARLCHRHRRGAQKCTPPSTSRRRPPCRACSVRCHGTMARSARRGITAPTRPCRVESTVVVAAGTPSALLPIAHGSVCTNALARVPCQAHHACRELCLPGEPDIAVPFAVEGGGGASSWLLWVFVGVEAEWEDRGVHHSVSSVHTFMSASLVSWRGCGTEE